MVYSGSKKTNRKSILLVTHNLNLEGAPLFLFNLAKGLKKMGYYVNLLSPSDGPLKDTFLREGIDVDISDFAAKEFDSSSFKGKYVAIIVNTIVGYKFLSKIDLKKEKTIWCLHESEREIYFRAFPDLEKSIFARVGKVVFSSKATREVYEDLNISGNFTIINTVGDWKEIDNYLKNNSKEKVRERYGFKESDVLISQIGTICPRKGQFELTEAAVSILKKSNNPNIKFLLIGGGRGYELEKTIRKLISANGLRDRIIIVNETEQIFDYYLMSDIFICNSYIEAFPLSILEAMAFSLPIISTDVYGISEQIEDGKDGLLIMAGDKKELEKKILYLLENKKKAKELGKNARKKIDYEFGFDEMINKYSRLISSKASGAHLKVSVVVPNYNYENFLEERLRSIVLQTYKPYEIIFLDDNSKDGSVELAKNFLSKIDIPHKIIKNESNVGCFKQWARGVREAVGDLIWIAEADDSCEPDLLEELATKFEDPEMGLAYTQSRRIDEFGKKEETYLPYLESIPGAGSRWKKDYINSGADEISKYLIIKNTIVNASAVLMRKSLLVDLGENIGEGLSQAGDWITYVRILSKSKIAFVAAPLNYHRHHSKTIVSRSGENTEAKAKQLIDETLYVQKFILSRFKVNRRRLTFALEHLKLVFRNNFRKELDASSEYSDKLKDYYEAAKNSQKRILFFSTNDGWGGSEVACAKMAQSFAAAGWRVALVMRKHDPRPDLLNSIDSGSSIELFEREPGDYCNSDETSEFVNEFDADIVYISQGHAFESAELMRWCKKNEFKYVNFIPLVTEYQLTFVNDKKDIEKNGELLRASKKIFLDNQNAKKVMRKMFNIAFDNFKIIRNGFDVQYHQEFVWNEPKGDEFKLAFIGRLENVHKGLDMLIEVLSMKKWKGRPLKVMTYGHGPSEESIRQTLERNKMSNFVLCGYTNNLKDSIQGVHGVIFPSRMEGTPISLVDSLLCYRMAIVTPVGGMPEMIADGLNGFVAKSISARGIDECLEWAWKKRREWKKLGENAGKIVRDKVPEFPHKQSIEEIEKLLS
ncbi:MAG: glycosyltransferase [Parcubacteria group bacterium]|jgi:glycosyltransferase involved in cell wall biosynthesis